MILRGTFWMSVTRILVNLIGFASTIILARLLTPEDFGLVAIAAAVATIFTAISELSLSQALIQHHDPQEEHFHTAFTMNVLRGILLASIIAGLGWPISAAYGDSRLIGVLAGFSVANLFGGLTNPKLALFERRLEFRQWIVLSGGEKLAGFLVAAIIAYLFRSYWALVAAVITSQCVRVIASYLLISYRPHWALTKYRELLSFSIWLTLGQIMQALNWRADPLALGAFLPTPSVGYFSMGSRVATMAVGELVQPVSQVLFPAFARIKKEQWRLRDGYLRAQGLICLVSMPIGFGLASTAKPLVLLFLGPKWVATIPVIQLLAVATAIKQSNQLNPVAMATGNTKALFSRDSRALFIRLPLILGGLALGPTVGIGSLFGALIGHLLSSMINSLLNMHLVSKISKVTVGDQLARIWRPVAAALLMGCAVSTVLQVSDFSETTIGLIAQVVGGSLLGGTAYFGALAMLWLLSGRPQAAETVAVDLLRQFLNKRAMR